MATAKRLKPIAKAPLSVAEISSCLETEALGRTLGVVSTIGSTNQYIKNNAAILDDGFVILSETQHAGRGRLGKSFISPSGGLYMSILLKDKKYTKNADYITVRASLAVTRAIEKLTHLNNVGIKWVNDIYCDDRKVCGILAERVVSADKYDYIVLGIGVNVITKPSDFSKEVRDIAGSLSDWCDVDFSKNILAAEIINNLEKYLGVRDEKIHSQLLEEYRQKSILIGKDIYVISGDQQIRARVIGIDDNASLYVQYDNGEAGILRTGEVSTKLVKEEEE